MENLLEELHSLIFVLVGIILGVLLSISIHYPLEMKELERASQACPDKKPVKVRIGISGRIYDIQCENGVELKIKTNQS